GPFVRAVGAATIGGLGETGEGRDRPIDQPQHLAAIDARRILEQLMSTDLAAPAADETAAPQIDEDLLEKALRNGFCLRDFARGQQSVARPHQSEQGFEGVACSLGDHGAAASTPGARRGSSLTQSRNTSDEIAAGPGDGAPRASYSLAIGQPSS